ncbi:tetratricopeptide repeat protein [Telluribacter sp. SYSU D00476]|uniref:tetratricopeptide repeat protein n=1 Tax=Telluribacter sp. SYSU D00476 TaxID=2811430 RepID=UPI001FF6A499|nr:tetratricopeptide repeat protein [Telluribacter sp. SYSU D00476]
MEESVNAVAINGDGNITLQGNDNSTITLNINDPQLTHKLEALDAAQMASLLQIKEQLADGFKAILDKVAQEKGDTTPPKELTLTIPKIDSRDIVGREKELEDLHVLLSQERRIVVVNGMGGIGKTTLAQVYVSKYYDHYKHIAWVTQSSESIETDFINDSGLIKNLSVSTANLEPKELFEDIIRRLKAIHDRPNLLIIDNGEQSLRKYLKILPSQPHWHLLATSREEIEGFYLMPLDFLTEEQAIKLFQKHYPYTKLSDQDIKELVVLVDYHTLTIEILAKIAKVQRYDLQTLKQAIKDDLRANVEVAHNRQQEKIEKVGSYLSTAFSLSKLNVAELWLLKQFTCLPLDFHTYNLLEVLLIDKQSPYKDVFAETLYGLVQKGWILYNSTTDSYKMHRIIAEAIRKVQPVSIDDVRVLIEVLTKELDLDRTKDNPVDKFGWIVYGKTVLNNFTSIHSDKIAELQNSLAITLRMLGQYMEAKDLLEKAKWFFTYNFGEDHTSTLKIYNNLALVHKQLGEYAEAKALLEVAVLKGEENLKQDDPILIRTYSNLGLVLQDLGEYGKARKLLEDAVHLEEKLYGIDHPFTSVDYSNLAMVLRELGEYEKAKYYVERALLIDEGRFGENHPFTAENYSNLGIILQDLGDYKAAKYFNEKALHANVKNYGEDHPATSRSYSNFAMVLWELGECERARELLARAVSSDEKNFGPDHPSTSRSYSNLALVLKDLGEYEQARELLARAVSSDEKNFGPDHPSIAINYSNLALVLKDLGEYEQARELLVKAVQLYDRNLGLDHPSTAICYCNLGLVLKELGEYEQARELLARAVSSDEKNFGPDHPSTAISYSNLALVLQELDDYQQARDLLVKAVQSNEKIFGQNHPSTTNCYNNLALVLIDLGKYEQARELLEKVMLSDEKNFGLLHPSTAISYNNLALALQYLGQFEEANELISKALSIVRKVLPKEHPYIELIINTYAHVKVGLASQKENL